MHSLPGKKSLFNDYQFTKVKHLYVNALASRLLVNTSFLWAGSAAVAYVQRVKQKAPQACENCAGPSTTFTPRARSCWAQCSPRPQSPFWPSCFFCRTSIFSSLQLPSIAFSRHFGNSRSKATLSGTAFVFSVKELSNLEPFAKEPCLPLL